MSTSSPLPEPISRRRAIQLGGGVAVGLIAATTVASGAQASLRPQRGASGAPPTAPAAAEPDSLLPRKQIEAILHAEGGISNGVLSIGIDRTDIGTVKLRGIPIKPSFEVNGDLAFQPLSQGRAFFNGDIPVRPHEVNRVIDAILANGLVFQAEHQHFYDFDPVVWFIHFRGEGHPLALARAVRGVLDATSTPFPQKPPANPKTPLDKDRLERILHGYDAEIGDDGVVTVFIARQNPIFIDGIRVRPQTNIATNVAFEPLNADGSHCAVAPDFAMEAGEIDDVVRVMRHRGWDIGCLYNQETDEHPQLYFSHQIKTGDPYELAREVRMGLDQTNAR